MSSPLRPSPLYPPLSPLQAKQALEQTMEAGAEPGLSAEVQVTQRLGRFVLLSRLGEGGMGSVYAAYDEQLDRRVALKLLHQAQSAQGDQRQRVLREAQAMAQVSHPNVVHLYEVGEVGGRVFIAMEYIPGTTLTAWQQQAPRRWQETLALYRQAGEGLLAAHQQGLVHRDFKPDNVLVDEQERVHVADFGLARLQHAAPGELAADSLAATPPTALSSGQTQAGFIAGTPGYMSPEQYRGEPADPRSDQFSFCVALYQALAGRPPFAGDSMEDLAASVIGGKLRPAPAGSRLPQEIWLALSRGLSTDPAARFPSMAELLTELELESGTDPAASRILRRRMARVLLAVSAVGTVAVLETYGRHGVTVRSMVILAGCVLVLTTVWVLGFRRGMAVGSFHRESTNFNLIAMAGWFGFRCLCLGLKLSLLQAMTLDMMVLAGLYALISYQFFPSLWWLVAGLAAGSVGALLRPQNAEQIFLALYSIWPFAMAYALGKRPQTRQSGRTAAARRGSPTSRGGSQPSG